MMYFVVNNDLVRIIILIEYTLYMYTTNINSTYFTVITIEQNYIISYFDVIYVRL